MLCEVKQSLCVQIMDTIFLFVPFNLLIYKGIQFLEENYAYEQTLPRQTLLDDLDKVCNRNREKLKKAV